MIHGGMAHCYKCGKTWNVAGHEVIRHIPFIDRMLTRKDDPVGVFVCPCRKRNQAILREARRGTS